MAGSQLSALIFRLRPVKIRAEEEEDHFRSHREKPVVLLLLFFLLLFLEMKTEPIGQHVTIRPYWKYARAHW